ncbi:MAG: hypothetical protein ACYDIE_10155 [Candidatus Krumholzibacteriia bacterium]
MGGRILGRAALAAAALALALGAAIPETAQARPRLRARGWTPLARTDLVIEGGVAQPLGDLGGDYVSTVKGFGAETGYEVGARYRAVWRSGWALSPSFHFSDFGDFAGRLADDTPFVVKTSILRYGLDAQYFWNPVGAGPQPFLSFGLALCRNRYRDETLGASADFYEASMNALALAAGAGIKADTFEVSLTYNLNRFKSAQLLYFGDSTDYNWDSLSVRVGLALPGS